MVSCFIFDVNLNAGFFTRLCFELFLERNELDANRRRQQ